MDYKEFKKELKNLLEKYDVSIRYCVIDENLKLLTSNNISYLLADNNNMDSKNIDLGENNE